LTRIQPVSKYASILPEKAHSAHYENEQDRLKSLSYRVLFAAKREFVGFALAFKFDNSPGYSLAEQDEDALQNR